mgnify:CR=1 FL=1
MDISNKKKLLRIELKKKRNGLTKRQRIEKSEKITYFLCESDEFKHANNVFCYISYMNEVETNLLINFIFKQGLPLFVPKVINNMEMIAIKLNSLSDLEPDNIGILTPKSGEILLEPIDIAITPGIGFTKTGGRIGYGRGYYDRWFSKNLVKTKVGIAFENQIVEKLPLEETDISMDIIITEKYVTNLKN